MKVFKSSQDISQKKFSLETRKQDASLINKLKIMEVKKVSGHSSEKERMMDASLVAVSKLRKVVHKLSMESHLVLLIIMLTVLKILLRLRILMTNKNQLDFCSSEILGVILNGLELGLMEVLKWKNTNLKS
jgi:hypothetical protein